MMREFPTNYVENVRGEIKSGAEFWTKMASHGPLTVRFQKSGAMFGLLQQSDSRAIFIQYSLARPTSECPTILAPVGTPYYDTLKDDYEWQWGRADAGL